jgi:arylsulfatase A-like enzyme
MNDQGQEKVLKQRNQYSTDILAGRARDFIKTTSPGTPFLLWFTPRAPHGKLQPRRKDRGKYGGVLRQRSPDVLEADVADKPADIRNRKAPSLGGLDRLERKRLDLLAATDDAVASILATLDAEGQLANTVVFVLSDNGYMLGSHNCDAKGFPYRGATQVTMLASGPPFAAGVTDQRITANIDIAPTIAALAGVSLPEADGVPIFERTPQSQLLVENFGGSRGYVGLRTRDWLYVENGTGERELYDYQRDPYELDNLLASWNGHSPSHNAEVMAADFASRVSTLRGCSGPTCR